MIYLMDAVLPTNQVPAADIDMSGEFSAWITCVGSAQRVPNVNICSKLYY